MTKISEDHPAVEGEEGRNPRGKRKTAEKSGRPLRGKNQSFKKHSLTLNSQSEMERGKLEGGGGVQKGRKDCI